MIFKSSDPSHKMPNFADVQVQMRLLLDPPGCAVKYDNRILTRLIPVI